MSVFPLPTIDTPFGRLIDRLVPDVVMINMFPRTSHVVGQETSRVTSGPGY